MRPLTHDRWLLFVDEFDPHEPFDTPDPWRHRYQDDEWDPDAEDLIWPPYGTDLISTGKMSAAEGRHIRSNYGAKLSMIDHWFGQVLDALDHGDLWETTAVIVCTDHGHYLGEGPGDHHDVWGKPGVMQYEPLGHPPLLVAWPGVEGGGTSDALTTAVDLHATIADVFDADVPHRTHGGSLVPVLTGEANSIRDWALGGVFGNWVQVTDGQRKYARSSSGDNFPLSMWSNRWSTMPIDLLPDLKLPPPDRRATLDYMPGSDVPVIRQPFEPGDMLPFWAMGSPSDAHHLFDISVDPDEAEDRVGEAGERELIELLRTALDEVEAPAEQYERLGIA